MFPVTAHFDETLNGSQLVKGEYDGLDFVYGIDHVAGRIIYLGGELTDDEQDFVIDAILSDTYNVIQ